MRGDLVWYFNKIRDGGPEAEGAFVFEYLRACISVIQHNIFGFNIPDLEGFGNEILQEFIILLRDDVITESPEGRNGKSNSGIKAKITDETVKGREKNRAFFTAEPSCGYSPLLVSFSKAALGYGDSSESDPNNLWDFGDGIICTKDSPKHRYNNPGVYNVSLTVSSSDKKSVYTRKVFVSLDVNEEPHTIFREFINSRVDQYINKELRRLWLLIKGGDSKSRRQMRRFEFSIQRYIENHKYIRRHRFGKFISEEELAREIMDEWMGIAEGGKILIENFVAFLRQNMDRRIIDRLRRIETEQKRFGNYFEKLKEIIQSAASDDNKIKSIDLASIKVMLYECIKRLSPLERLVLINHGREGKNFAEIAKALESSSSGRENQLKGRAVNKVYVYRIWKKAKEKIQACLKKKGIDFTTVREML